ncbi:acyl-homoserine-lactone synthase [Novosphingobium kaempferiae]|uniref:acyl-homoserine-lactone synthase n=1 Tax=Novosphingobium kaempferiae TaxID=2896849 RepID=UPI001E48D49B|nr:acyl-homoserine-lactone synthase [Novosphingobium kaempferiae]
MLHVLNPSPSVTSGGPAALRETTLFGAMFEARKSVFVDLLRWDVPVLAGRYEIDQFDDSHARYLVISGEDGAHRASARLLPTIRPHILDSFYGVLCEATPPRGDTVWEITRFCLDRSLRAQERRQARDKLVRALVDHALASGITAYSAIAEVNWCNQILGFGWRCRQLGPACRIGGQTLAALRIEIESDTPARLARAGIGQDIRADTRTAARAAAQVRCPNPPGRIVARLQ